MLQPVAPRFDIGNLPDWKSQSKNGGIQRLGFLGKGTFSHVYAAVDQRNPRMNLAVKSILPASAEEDSCFIDM